MGQGLDTGDHPRGDENINSHSSAMSPHSSAMSPYDMILYVPSWAYKKTYSPDGVRTLPSFNMAGNFLYGAC